MREIEIGRENDETHPFVAIDLTSKSVIFRHNDLEQLRSVCRKLRWNIRRDTADAR